MEFTKATVTVTSILALLGLYGLFTGMYGLALDAVLFIALTFVVTEQLGLSAGSEYGLLSLLALHVAGAWLYSTAFFLIEYDMLVLAVAGVVLTLACHEYVADTADGSRAVIAVLMCMGLLALREIISFLAYPLGDGVGVFFHGIGDGGFVDVGMDLTIGFVTSAITGWSR